MSEIKISDVVTCTVPSMPHSKVNPRIIYRIIAIDGSLATCIYSNSANEPISVQLPVDWLKVYVEPEKTKFPPML